MLFYEFCGFTHSFTKYRLKGWAPEHHFQLLLSKFQPNRLRPLELCYEVRATSRQPISVFCQMEVKGQIRQGLVTN